MGKGRQWEEDKRVQEEKKGTDFRFNFYIVTFGDGEEKNNRPLIARISILIVPFS